MGSLNTSDPDVWMRVKSCIYSVLIMTANAIAAPAPVLAPSAFDLALIAAASARACPGALRSGEWMRSFQRDVASYWDNPAQSGKSDSVFFIVVSGTSFMRNRARAVRCSWAARAQKVLLISGKHEVFVDRCSTLAGANYPYWHALHASHAVSSSSLKNLTARALSHDDFFSSVPHAVVAAGVAAESLRRLVLHGRVRHCCAPCSFSAERAVERHGCIKSRARRRARGCDQVAALSTFPVRWSWSRPLSSHCCCFDARHRGLH